MDDCLLLSHKNGSSLVNFWFQFESFCSPFNFSTVTLMEINDYGMQFRCALFLGYYRRDCADILEVG